MKPTLIERLKNLFLAKEFFHYAWIGVCISVINILLLWLCIDVLGISTIVASIIVIGGTFILRYVIMVLFRVIG